jgi:hypothetical protein
MKQILSITLLTMTMLSLNVVAWPQSQGDSVVVAEGAQARLSLQTQLSSKLSEVGDQVTAVLYEPVRDMDGRVAIPRGTEFTGRVTQVQPARRLQKEATMTIVFDKMRLSYGEEKISTVVTAIDDFANDEKLKSEDGEGKVGGGRSGDRTARNAGTGATLGGLGGLIIGAAGGGLGGAAASVGAGALGGVLMTKGNDIKLATGTILRIRFERPVNVPAVESRSMPLPGLALQSLEPMALGPLDRQAGDRSPQITLLSIVAIGGIFLLLFIALKTPRAERENHLPSRWMLHPQPTGLDGEEIETGCELKGLALRRTYG